MLTHKENLKLMNLFDSHISQSIFWWKNFSIAEGDTEDSAFNYIREKESLSNEHYHDLNIN